MDQKNLMAQAAGPVNPTTTGELPAPELAELSEEALQQIVGGDEPDNTVLASITRNAFKDVTINGLGITKQKVGES